MKKRNIFRRALPLILALALLIPISGPMAVTDVSAKPTQAEIDKLKSDAKDLANQKKDVQNRLKEVRADKNKALERKELLEETINLIQAEIDNLDGQIRQYDELIGQKGEEIAENQRKEEAQYQLFCKRVREMEEDGEVSYWSILFDSSDFADLLDNFMVIEEIMEYDNSVIDSLIALREQIEAEKAEMEKVKAEKEDARQVQVTAKKEQQAQEAEVDKLIKEIRADEATLEKAEAELKAAAKAMDAEIRRKEQEMASQISNVVSESGFLWPLAAGYNTLSSLYGGRIHPISGKPNNHTGIDIPAPKGVTIMAAKSGVVVTSTYNSSYGNYVVVSHSDGSSTLYAHMSKRSVSVGQTVKQGQKLGEIGTTGRSTGNHLHFEVRVKGTRKDPVDFFKSKTLYVKDGGRKEQLKHQ